MKLGVAFFLCIPVLLLAGPVTVVTTGPDECSTSESPYITGLGGGGGSMSIVSTALAVYLSPSGIGSGPSTCTVTVTADLETAGPVRPGFLQFSLFGLGEPDGPSGGYASFFVNGTQYGSCTAGHACTPFSDTIPFTLGTPFEITTSAFGSALILNSDTSGAGLIQATISAYEYSPLVLSPLFPVISLFGGITNPLFSGNPESCPTGWICSGSPAPGFASYAPTTAQYPAGSPFPTSAFSPTVYGGSGVIRQLTSLNWVGGATYQLGLWTGLPNTEPDGRTLVAGWPQAPNGVARLYLTMGAGFGQVAAFDIPAPPQGGFTLDNIAFTLPSNSGAIGQQIGVMIFVSAPSGFSANFAITSLGVTP
jgi:hypothetical protein